MAKNSKFLFWIVIIVVIVIIVYFASSSDKNDNNNQPKEKGFSELVIEEELFARMQHCEYNEKLDFPGFENLNWCDYTPKISELQFLRGLKGVVTDSCNSYNIGKTHEKYNITIKHPDDCIEFIDNSDILWESEFESSPAGGRYAPSTTRYRIIKNKENFYFVKLNTPSPVYTIYKVNIDEGFIGN
jgi:hypothetical protein